MEKHEILKPQWIDLFGLNENLMKVDDSIKTRNNKNVRVIRYQLSKPTELDRPHITFVIEETGSLLSFVNHMLLANNGSFTETQALEKAETVFQELVPTFSKGLSYLRTDVLARAFIGSNGNTVFKPIYWVKFVHINGSYNWVGFTMDGNIEEFEINSFWDFSRMRRKTEMWDNDGWVKARLGIGPELESPNALARV